MRDYHEQRPRRNLIWPLALVLVGGVLLANNLGLLGADLRDNLWSLWPLLLILLGINGLFEREGVVGPTLMIGLGVVFLMSNFGYLAISPWQVIMSLWPVLIIAIGFDLMIGRRSWLLSLVGVAVVVLVLIWSINVLSAGGVRGRSVSYDMQSAQTLDVMLNPPVGSLSLAALDAPGARLEGNLPDSERMQLQEDFQVTGDKASLIWRAGGAQTVVSGSLLRFIWQLRLPPEKPIALAVDMGVGEMTLDLQDLQVEDVNAKLGVGQQRVNLPAAADVQGRLEVGIGQMIVSVPAGVGLRIQVEKGLAALSIPDSYVRVGDSYTSPGFDSAEYQIELQIDLAIGSIIIK